MINGIQRAREEAQAKWGISSELIMSYLRHLSEEDAFETLSQSLPYKHLIKAVGLDSSEKGNPPSKFKNVFKASAAQGYVLLAHAGEEGPAEYVWEAIDELKIVRIDHGNNCLTDEKLVKEIIKRDLALTVCPLSNLKLRVVKDLQSHPLREMMKKGLKITINSDDPAYFGGYLNQNYHSIQEALDLTKEELLELAKNSFQYSLLDDKRKKELLQHIEIYEKTMILS